MPVSHMHLCAPSQAAVHASWKWPLRAFCAASCSAFGGSRIARSASASSEGLCVLYGQPKASPWKQDAVLLAAEC